MARPVETSTPPNTSAPIGPYSHISLQWRPIFRFELELLIEVSELRVEASRGDIGRSPSTPPTEGRPR